MMFLILIGQFWVALFPIGGKKGADANNFFQNYLALPVFLVLCLGYKTYYKDWRLVIPAEEVDLVSHRKLFDEDVLKQEDEEYKLRLKHASFWAKMQDFWC